MSAEETKNTHPSFSLLAGYRSWEQLFIGVVILMVTFYVVTQLQPPAHSQSLSPQLIQPLGQQGGASATSANQKTTTEASSDNDKKGK